MSLTDLITIVALLVAPFLAVFAQKQIEIWREKKSTKVWIFKTLMATRGRTLSLEHVQALNMIDLEFNNHRDKAVIHAWKEYHNHLNSFPKDEEDQQGRIARWGEKKDELFISLLEKMGSSLGFDFDPVQIRRGAYAPEGHAAAEMEMQIIRKMILEWLGGERRVTVSLVPNNEKDAQRNIEFYEKMLNVLKGDQSISVEISNK